ncbi:2-hydroxyisoflavanone dehydratase [Spatholobus suberectus]|nr:2-hydroxyisoflavanone dehydratase [Spatholobus suberectus]
MASTAPIASDNPKEIVAEIPTYIRVFSDGTVERPRQAPFVPASIDDPPTGVSSKDIVISHNPPLSARLYLPKLTTLDHLPILVYFHGGGFFFESAFSQLYHDHFNTFVSQTNCIVVSVEYRLAPEHLLPACYHDCWDALKWVASQSSNNPTNAEPWLTHHGDFRRIFIGGDSAGGNIVHNVAVRAGTEPLPCDVKLLGAIFSHPYFCSSYPIGSEPVTGHEQSLAYLVWNFVYPSAPGGIDNPMINPVAPGAPSLAGLGGSKIVVCVAGEDKIRDRGVWYYEAVKKSGWLGELELFEQNGEDHVYHIFHPESENGMKLIKRLGLFLHE